MGEVYVQIALRPRLSIGVGTKQDDALRVEFLRDGLGQGSGGSPGNTLAYVNRRDGERFRAEGLWR
jgi:hypothetical protein